MPTLLGFQINFGRSKIKLITYVGGEIQLLVTFRVTSSADIWGRKGQDDLGGRAHNHLS